MKDIYANGCTDAHQDRSFSQMKRTPQRTPLRTPLRTAREGKALFLGFSILAGAITFCLAMQSLGEFIPKDWWWMAIAIAIIGLPPAFEKLRRSPEPYIIQFAQAFRIGFWSILSTFGQLIGSNYLHLAKTVKHSVNSTTHKFDIDST